MINKKSLLIFTALALTLCCVLCGCTNKQQEHHDEPLATISLNYNVVDLPEVNGSVLLRATVTNSHEQVVWVSSDTSIATVVNGQVNAVSQGTATITATVAGVSATCTVNVVGGGSGPSLVPVAVLEFSVDVTKVQVGYQFELSANFTLEGKTVDGVTVTYESSDLQVLSVAQNLVTANGVGIAEITASCSYQGKLYQQSVQIEVIGE